LLFVISSFISIFTSIYFSSFADAVFLKLFDLLSSSA